MRVSRPSLATKVRQPSLSAGASTHSAKGAALVWKLSQQQALSPPSGQVVSPQEMPPLLDEELLEEELLLDEALLEEELLLDEELLEEALLDEALLAPPLPPPELTLVVGSPPDPSVLEVLLPPVEPLLKRASALLLTPPHPKALRTPPATRPKKRRYDRFIKSLRAHGA